MNKWKNTDLKQIAHIFDLEVGGAKDKLIERIIAFLFKPESSVRSYKKRKASTSTSGTSKGKKKKRKKQKRKVLVVTQDLLVIYYGVMIIEKELKKIIKMRSQWI